MALSILAGLAPQFVEACATQAIQVAPQIVFCADQAEATLAVSRIDDAGLIDGAVNHLRESEGFQRLMERSRAMGSVDFDKSMNDFAVSQELRDRQRELSAVLDAWKSADIASSVSKAHAYLPADTPLQATIYLVIKKRPNSFVFDLGGRPAIFLSVDPEISAAEIENTIAHELHHVGMHAITAWRTGSETPADSPLAEARSYVGAFGEGFAMLAAAGGPDVHPHATSPDKARERWDRDVARFPSDLHAVDVFLKEVATGKLKADEALKKAMAEFWGDAQGAWYTVGYRMAVEIETALGRDRLIECMTDTSQLLATYNAVAIQRNKALGASLPLWSQSLLQLLDGSGVASDG